MMQAGDVVSISGRSGLWALLEPLPSGAGTRWRCVQWAEPPRVFDAAEGAMTLAARPAFTPGMALRHWGRPVEVVAASAGLVRVHQRRQKPATGSAGFNLDGETEAQAGWLSAENATALADAAA